MTLDEAVAEFEKDFIVERERGFLVLEPYERRDMDLTPNGDRYVSLITAGWYADEEDAAEAWIKEAWSFAERRTSNRLFWGEVPVWRPWQYIGLDQAGMLNDKWLNTSLQLMVGRVYCTLFIESGKATGNE